MDEIIPINAVELHGRTNSLAVKLNIYKPTAKELFYLNPSAETLDKIPRTLQTTEIITHAVEHDGNALKAAAKKLITEDICRKAVAQNETALVFVPKKLLTKELCQIAVMQNGNAIKFVPEMFLDSDICFSSLKNKVNSIRFIPAEYLTVELCEYAFNIDRSTIRYIPEKWITSDMVMKAVDESADNIQYIPKSFLSKELCELVFNTDSNTIRYIPIKWITSDMARKAVNESADNIQYIPVIFLSKALCELAFNNDWKTIRYIPERRITSDMVMKAVNESVDIIKYIPSKFYSEELFQKVFKKNPFMYESIPEEYITAEMCLWFIENSDTFETKGRIFTALDLIPAVFLDTKEVLDFLCEKYCVEDLMRWNNRISLCNSGKIKRFSNDSIEYIKWYFVNKEKETVAGIAPLSSVLPDISDTEIIEYSSERKLYRCGGDFGFGVRDVFYISDIHIEHQLEAIHEKYRKDYDEIEDFIYTKVSEMISSVNVKSGLLLIAGDIAHTPLLTGMFYKELYKQWNGKILSVLGNHELWYYGKNDNIQKGIAEIKNMYQNLIRQKTQDLFNRITLLENDLFVVYKNKSSVILNEEQLLGTDINSLKSFLEDSLFILLAGTGFSGMNHKFNAERGLYRDTITSKSDDILLSEKFKRLHDLIMQCVPERKVIVLTHMPVQDWNNGKCNPNWIYINGHTHNNVMVKDEQITLLSDNQIGYKPAKWKLNCVRVPYKYEFYDNLGDGIYKITSEMYKDFNVARGINSKGFNSPGQIIMLKKSSIYLFLFKNEKGLYLLNGGRKCALDNQSIEYYYENMPAYYSGVIQIFEPYRNYLKMISREISLIGGNGKIHGCIVDIDFYNHIYVNYDGKLTPYYAMDKSERLIYPNIVSLLEERIPELLSNYEQMSNRNVISVINSVDYLMDESRISEVDYISDRPEYNSDNIIYEQSGKARTLQYIFDKNVIRIWDPLLLETEINIKKISNYMKSVKSKELNSKAGISRENTLSDISNDEKYKEGYEEVKTQFIQNEKPIKDSLGARWIKCIRCGCIKTTDEFTSYGGSGSVNSGICSECNAKSRNGESGIKV